MRRLIASVILSAAMIGVVSLAMAIELPINGTYGSSEAACSYYLGGGYLSDEGGLVEERVIVVSPQEIAFIEAVCEPTAVDGNKVLLFCGGEGYEWTQSVKITVSLDKSLLNYLEVGEPIELRDERAHTVVETTDRQVPHLTELRRCSGSGD